MLIELLILILYSSHLQQESFKDSRRTNVNSELKNYEKLKKKSSFNFVKHLGHQNQRMKRD